MTAITCIYKHKNIIPKYNYNFNSRYKKNVYITIERCNKNVGFKSMLNTATMIITELNMNVNHFKNYKHLRHSN
jgi:hypothetical protein